MHPTARLLLGLTTAAALGLGLPATAASATTASAAASVARAAETWSWGPTASSDRRGWAGGVVRSSGTGLRIHGDLYDAAGARTCSWLKIKWLSDHGRWHTKTFRNCSQSRVLSFRVNAGYMLTSSAKVCRGTSTRITGRCSGWEGVWSQGG
ncbi:hypothetical protein AB0D67_23615 [Streptosporangium sp. NPDC048047]|uniref:hypothetical protein n=1 Tax=Streptosporangium sp. NPDC048047 TaxID=3155748 RepID=UPI00343B7F7A